MSDYPIWAFPPSWGEGAFIETYSWLTNVLRDGIKGTEQRQGLRRTPRRMLEASYTVLTEQRTRLDLLLRAAGGGKFRVPLWHMAVDLQGLHAGDFSIDYDFRGRDVAPNSQLLIYGSGADDTEVVNVGSLDGLGRAQLLSNVVQNWPAATVVPLRDGILTDQPRTQRRNSIAEQVQARFQFSGANDYIPAPPTLTYLGSPVLVSNANDESSGTEMSLQRLLVTADNRTGGVYRMDTGGRAIATQNLHLAVPGAYGYNRLRDFLYTLGGQLRPLWVPTFADDCTLRQPALKNATALTINNVGYHIYGINLPDRGHLFIELNSGEQLCFAITGAAVSGDGFSEVLSIDPPLPLDVTPDNIYNFCFMAHMRSASDDIELVSVSGMDGLTTCNMTLMSAPDLRVGIPPASVQYPKPNFVGTFATDGLVGGFYSSRIRIRGADGNYTLRNGTGLTSGSLPPGLSFTIVGYELVLEGTITGPGGDATCQVTVDSGDGQSVSTWVTIHVPVAILRKYWRLLFTPSDAATPVGLQEIEMRALPGGADVTTAAEAPTAATASSTAAGSTPSGAFDGIRDRTNTHSWRAAATGNAWLTYHFAAATDINELLLWGMGAAAGGQTLSAMSLLPGDGGGGTVDYSNKQDPGTVALQYSNDGVGWTTKVTSGALSFMSGSVLLDTTL